MKGEIMTPQRILTVLIITGLAVLAVDAQRNRFDAQPAPSADIALDSISSVLDSIVLLNVNGRELGLTRRDYRQFDVWLSQIYSGLRQYETASAMYSDALERIKELEMHLQSLTPDPHPGVIGGVDGPFAPPLLNNLETMP